jgi:hypothetical protein
LGGGKFEEVVVVRSLDLVGRGPVVLVIVGLLDASCLGVLRMATKDRHE